MIKIAIIDDEEACRETLSNHIKRFFNGRDEKYNIVQYSDAIDFLTNYKFSFDIVFLDIDMRLSNGMDMAYKLRELDQNIVIIFQTHLAQYAIKGYEVGAIGYLLKPVDYYSVSMRLKSALKVVAMNEIDVNIRITTNDGMKNNAGKTYADAIAAYYQIIAEKKHGKTEIGKQFEYNTYIRDFFADNQGKTLEDAIRCWKYKKSLQGHNRYEASDLVALSKL